MHRPIIGGSRRNPLPEEPAPSPPKQEPQNAVPAQTHAAHEERQEALTQEEVLTEYHANPGKCPICGCKAGRGFTGHLSKCLRIHNSKIGSILTT